jgi:hypothetical protein
MRSLTPAGAAPSYVMLGVDNIPQVFWATLYAGLQGIYIFGEDTYFDAFGERHVSRFRFVLSGRDALEGSIIRACDEGNEAD